MCTTDDSSIRNELTKQVWAVSISLHGETIDPGTVTEILGIQPTRSHRRGDPIGARTQATRTAHYWSLQSPLREDASLDAHVAWLVAQLEPHAKFIREYGVRGEQARLCIGCFLTGDQGGFTLREDILATVALLGMSLYVDIYAGDPV